MLRPRKEFMEAAIVEAVRAREAGDYAVGAVLIKGEEIIARASNRSKRDESPIAHAEVLAILEGCRKFKSRHLTDCVLYATHEPCPMCSALVVWAKLSGVVYGAGIGDMADFRDKSNSEQWLWRTINIPLREVIAKSTEKIEVVAAFMREECLKLFHS